MTDEQTRTLAVLKRADPGTSLVDTEPDGALLVEHCPREEKLGRRVGGELRKPMGVSRTFVYRVHPGGDRCGYGWAACASCGAALVAGDRTLELPVAIDGRRVNESEAADYRGVISQRKGTRWDAEHPSLNVFFDGSDDDVRAHLEAVFGTRAFSLAGHAIELELPRVGKDWRPRSTGETVPVRFSAPASWSVQAPARGRWWHVVPGGADETLCTIALSTWASEVVTDDDQPITCPWCRARMVAIEIAAPPGSEGQHPVARPKLHEEIQRILRESGGSMTTSEIARAVREAGRYKKRDGTSNVSSFQIHGRTKASGDYAHLFERDGSQVRLRDPA